MKCLGAVWAMGLLSTGILLPLGAVCAQAQALPEGPGKALTVDNCSTCHGVDLLTVKRRSSEDWKQVVDRMMSNGASMSDDQYNEVLAYLGKYLGTAPVAGTAPASSDVASNTAKPAQAAPDIKQKSR